MKFSVYDKRSIGHKAFRIIFYTIIHWLMRNLEENSNKILYEKRTKKRLSPLSILFCFVIIINGEINILIKRMDKQQIYELSRGIFPIIATR